MCFSFSAHVRRKPHNHVDLGNRVCTLFYNNTLVSSVRRRIGAINEKRIPDEQHIEMENLQAVGDITPTNALPNGIIETKQ